MDGLLRNYDQIEKSATAGMGSVETVQMRLKRRLQEYNAQARKIEQLLGLLERNPDFEKFLDLSRDIF